MGTTDKGIVFPDADSHTRLWEHFESLAESVDEAIDAGTGGDTGLITAWTPMTLTPAAGFSVTAARYRLLLGVLVCLDCTFTRTGADITASSSGNITDTAIASGVPSVIRPSATRYLDFMRGSAAEGCVQVKADGGIDAVTLEGNAVLESTIVVHDFYVLG